MQSLVYNPSGALIGPGGLLAADLEKLAPQLAGARDEVLQDVELWQSGQPVPVAKQPLDAGFVDLPDRLLAAYRQRPDQSELGRILQAADRIAQAVDRVCVLGIGGSYMGARALFEALCHPYHNELDRPARGGRPRISFAGNNLDNDATQGLLDLLGRGRVAGTVQERWAIVVVSKSGGTLETAVAMRQLLTALRGSCNGDERLVAELVVPVTGPSGRLYDLAQELGCVDRFTIPDGIGGRFSVLTAVGLLPAAIVGLDIVALLEGAAAMNRLFRTAPAGANPVLDFAGVCQLMEQQRGAHTRVLATWGAGLEAAGLWYDQLLAESLGKHERGALPLSVVNTRDLHSRGQQHQEGRRDKLITNLVVDRCRRAPLAVGTIGSDHDRLDALAKKTLPDILAAALAGTNRAYAEDGRPTAEVRLPALDAAALGQLFQMLMLATVVEGRMIDINPYGQPGVEAYKRHMNEFLRFKEAPRHG